MLMSCTMNPSCYRTWASNGYDWCNEEILIAANRFLNVYFYNARRYSQWRRKIKFRARPNWRRKSHANRSRRLCWGCARATGQREIALRSIAIRIRLVRRWCGRGIFVASIYCSIRPDTWGEAQSTVTVASKQSAQSGYAEWKLTHLCIAYHACQCMEKWFTLIPRIIDCGVT